MDIKLGDATPIKFSEADVPVNYQWSGYVESVEEFKQYNFLVLTTGKQINYICSSENGVALGNYLSRYILKEKCVLEIEDVISPGYDYWFFQAWEMAEPYYDDLDVWIKDIVSLFISKGYIIKILIRDSVYFSFSDLAVFEEMPLPNDIRNEIEQICRSSLIQYFEDKLNEYGDLNEVSLGDGGEWARSIFDEFLLTHSND